VITDLPGVDAYADLFLALHPIVLRWKLQQMRWSIKIGFCVVIAGVLMKVNTRRLLTVIGWIGLWILAPVRQEL